MKKSLSRILSLALVLAMLVSVVPFAMAEAAEEDGCSVTVDPASDTLTLGGEKTSTTISASVSAGPHYTAGAVVWTGDAQTASGDTATFTATAAGEYSVTATVTFTKIVEGDGATDVDEDVASLPATVEKSATCTIKVVDPEAYEVTVTPSSLNLVVGESKSLTVAVTNGLGEAVEPVSVTWASSAPDIADVTNGSVTAKKAGSAGITASVVPAEGKAPIEATCSVTVKDGAVIECANGSAVAGSSVTLTPTLKVNGVAVNDAVFSFSGTGVVPAANGKTATVTRSTPGLVEVKISVASYTVGGTAVEVSPITATVRFSGSADIDVTATASTFTFSSTSVLSKAYYNNGEIKNPALTSVSQLLKDACSYNGGDPSDCTYRIVTSDTRLAAAWSTSLTNLGPTAMEKVTFTQNASSTGNCTAVFYILDSEGRDIASGNLTIRPGTTYSITYETDYKTAVTFEEDDFVRLWNSVYTSSTNTMKYVVFGVGSNVPAYGELYTSASTTTRKTVTSSMKFGTTSTYEDLDAVTYVPSTTYTTAYKVEIPFTIYGGAGLAYDTALTGSVVIELNTTTNSITSRGVVFGSGTVSIADQMAADYKSFMNTDLGSVVFYLPDVEDGRLYYDYDGILESVRVSSKDTFYYYAASVTSRPNPDLDKVAFIPAAGTTGKVTISYIGRDKNGNNPYEGKIVLNVTAKTKSDKFTDVTASSYSWAADSIDFLYYEEVVNGTSSTKFGPSASITRGDFMIMLYRAFLEEEYDDYNVTSNFADVPKGASDYEKETYQAVGVAKYLGIAKGDGTNFNPKSSITREEAMTLIYRTLDEVNLDLEYTSTKTTASFSDYSKVSTYAQTSITYLIKHGIVIGSNGLINPKSNITRAEMAVILHRVLTY